VTAAQAVWMIHDYSGGVIISANISFRENLSEFPSRDKEKL
jgi:hypothetical protein